MTSSINNHDFDPAASCQSGTGPLFLAIILINLAIGSTYSLKDKMANTITCMNVHTYQEMEFIQVPSHNKPP